MFTPSLIRRPLSVTAGVVAALVVGTAAMGGSAEPLETVPASVGSGELEVHSSPDVATQIRVGDVVRNSTSVRGLPLTAGTHQVCFSAPAGYLPPPCESVTVEADRTARVTGEFVEAGRLVVETEPPELEATVIVDGIERDGGSIALPIAVGDHRVCFEAIADHLAPACQDVEVVASEETVVQAAYTLLDDVAEPDPDPVDPGEDEAGTVVETTEVYSWTLGGRTMTREHEVTVDTGRLAIRLDFERADEVRVALLDADGAQLAAGQGASGIQFGAEVPSGTYQITVTGTRAHYDLAVTAKHTS